ncbi:MAG: hypothetical protein C5B58_07080 [Acidobacteria bacterium]|nr:MAG: hypothetical protein C5B58_07080 [Acidobacteriota bacterium]
MLKSLPRLTLLGPCFFCSFLLLASSADSTRTTTDRKVETVSSPFQLPRPTGSYGVGRVSYSLIDRSRPEPLAQTAGAIREVIVEIWYPAETRPLKRSDTAPYLPGFEAAKPKMIQDDIKDLFSPATYSGSLPETHTVENAPIARGNRKFPLLVFSHGWGNPTFLYTAELEDIASHGYIVAAVDHPYDTAFTQFPDGRIALFAQKEFDTASKQPNGYISYARQRVEVMAEDNRFALTELLRYATIKTLHAPFFQRVDEMHIGAFGHSIGGLASARTCQIDNRVKACMDQDSADDRGSPFIATDLKQTEQQPFLLFVAFSRMMPRWRG